MDTPAGWYADPHDPNQQRYWDGSIWTEHTAPVAAPPPPPQGAPAAPAVPETEPAPDSEAPTGLRARAAKIQENADARAERISAIGAPTDGSYRISEEGKNGTVAFGPKGLDRVVKKTLGKDDRQFIPYSSISMVAHDRKRAGRDVVTVHVGTKSYGWKIQTDAEGFVNRLNELIA